MKNAFILFTIISLSGLLLISCNQKEQHPWSLHKQLRIDNFTPVGIANFKNYYFISDSTQDVIYMIDSVDNSIYKELHAKEPMYIKVNRARLLIPSFSSDTVFVFRGENSLYPLETFGVLDGSVGVDAKAMWEYVQVSHNDHLVHFRNDQETYLLGGKGSEQGKLMNPSNVAFIDSLIYVVDSGNKRIQVFNNKGEFDFLFGEELGMEWPTGISYSDSTIFISDAIVNEIFVFDYRGVYKYSITNGLDGPSDINYFESKLYVANLRGAPIKIFKPNTNK